MDGFLVFKYVYVYGIRQRERGFFLECREVSGWEWIWSGSGLGVLYYFSGGWIKKGIGLWDGLKYRSGLCM